MKRWLVIVPAGDEVKYSRSPYIDVPIACDLDALEVSTAPASFFGLPVYDVTSYEDAP